MEEKITELEENINLCKDASEKKQLRDKEKQLRDEKKQLRDEKLLLLQQITTGKRGMYS